MTDATDDKTVTTDDRNIDPLSDDKIRELLAEGERIRREVLEAFVPPNVPNVRFR